MNTELEPPSAEEVQSTVDHLRRLCDSEFGYIWGQSLRKAADLIERLAARLADSDARLCLARDALECYFKPDEIGEDVAPRITEMYSAFLARLAERDKELQEWKECAEEREQMIVKIECLLDWRQRLANPAAMNEKP